MRTLRAREMRKKGWIVLAPLKERLLEMFGVSGIGVEDARVFVISS
jgi:hypothetical protein